MERIVAAKSVKSPTFGLQVIWSNKSPPACSNSTIVSVAFA
jgi:hypothetical protein